MEASTKRPDNIFKAIVQGLIYAAIWAFVLIVVLWAFDSLVLCRKGAFITEAQYMSFPIFAIFGLWRSFTGSGSIRASMLIPVLLCVVFVLADYIVFCDSQAVGDDGAVGYLLGGLLCPLMGAAMQLLGKSITRIFFKKDAGKTEE